MRGGGGEKGRRRGRRGGGGEEGRAGGGDGKVYLPKEIQPEDLAPGGILNFS